MEARLNTALCLDLVAATCKLAGLLVSYKYWPLLKLEIGSNW